MSVRFRVGIQLMALSWHLRVVMHSLRARHAVLNRVLAARPFAVKAHVSISFVGDKVS